MAVYRAFVVNNAGQVVSFQTFNGCSDADALAWAEQIIGGDAIEVWLGERFVAQLNHAKPA